MAEAALVSVSAAAAAAAAVFLASSSCCPSLAASDGSPATVKRKYHIAASGI